MRPGGETAKAEGRSVMRTAMRAALSGIADASQDVASIVGRHNSGDGLGNRDDDRLRTLAVIWAAGRPAFITDGITLTWPPPQASSVQHNDGTSSSLSAASSASPVRCSPRSSPEASRARAADRLRCEDRTSTTLSSSSLARARATKRTVRPASCGWPAMRAERRSSGRRDRDHPHTCPWPDRWNVCALPVGGAGSRSVGEPWASLRTRMRVCYEASRRWLNDRLSRPH
jgi:hypothetical protein